MKNIFIKLKMITLVLITFVSPFFAGFLYKEINAQTTTCSFMSANWSSNTLPENTYVTLVLWARDCDQMVFNFEVWEASLSGDRLVASTSGGQLKAGTLRNNKTTIFWKTERVDDGGDGDPEYYFKAILQSDPSIVFQSSGPLAQLTVTQSNSTPQEHPFLIVNESLYPAIRSKISSEPWSTMATQAINSCNNLVYPCANGDVFCMQDLISACTLAYVVDPDNNSTYKDKIVDTWSHWTEILAIQRGDNDGTRDVSNNYYTWASRALFHTIIALDIVHDDLTPQELAFIEDLMQEEFNHYYTLPTRHPPAREAIMALWKIYRGDSSELDKLLLGGILNNGEMDIDGDGDNIEGYIPELASRISNEGVYREGSSYAFAAWGLDRDERAHLVDVLEFTGKDDLYGLDFYTNPKFQNFYEWLFGYATTPNGVHVGFGDTYSFRRLTEILPRGNSTANSQHVGQARLFSDKAWHYAEAQRNGIVPLGEFLQYLFTESIPTPTHTPVSRYFENGPSYLISKPYNDQSYFGALWNITAPTEGSGVFHNHDDVNAIYVAAFGEQLLMNSGFAGSNSPAGPDPCGGEPGDRFTTNYLGHRAISNNTALINYDIGTNFKDPSEVNDHVGKYGLGTIDALMGGNIVEYSSANSGTALPNGVHTRNFFFVHPTGATNGYFVTIDDISSTESGNAHLAFHPNSTTQQVISVNTEYLSAPLARTLNESPSAGITIFYATPPSSVESYPGTVCNGFNGDYLFSTYPLNPDNNKSIVTVLFPHDPSHPKAEMERVAGNNFTGAKINHSASIYDYVFETAGNAQIEEAQVNGSGFYRVNDGSVNSFLVKNASSFSANSNSYGFSSQSAVSLNLEGVSGRITTSGGRITLRYPGVVALWVNGQNLPVLDSGNGWVEADIPQGSYEIELITDPNVTPSVITPTLPPGDANGDGRVDGVDYVVWLTHYNQNTENGPSDGDFNDNGVVDGVDYVVWLNNYSS